MLRCFGHPERILSVTLTLEAHVALVAVPIRRTVVVLLARTGCRRSAEAACSPSHACTCPPSFRPQRPPTWLSVRQEGARRGEVPIQSAFCPLRIVAQPLYQQFSMLCSLIEKEAERPSDAQESRGENPFTTFFGNLKC